MSWVTSLAIHAFMTIYLLFVTGRVAQKVYFDCGAQVDVMNVQGLILSPGFPYNYSSGTHCIWQFFVPVDYQLILEIFDFDVFESHDAATQYAAVSNFEEDEAGKEVSFTSPIPRSEDLSSKALRSSQNDNVQQVVVQEKSTKMEMTKVTNSAQRSTDTSSNINSPPLPSLSLVPGAQPPEDKAANSASSSLLRGDSNAGLHPNSSPKVGTPAPQRPTDTPAASSETPLSSLDACPHDVLYISDLITFSSRFCGSNRPPSNQLVFGSSHEMVEVIMELITTTHWGRGFALLFHYHNRTDPGGDRHTYAPTAAKIDSFLAAVSGAAFFAMILTSALCIVFRPKLCPKRASSCTSSNSEVPEGVQSTEAEVSELQLVAANQANMEVPGEQENNNLSLSHGLQHPGSASGDVSQNTEMELSSGGLTELDLETDEVFIASSAPSPVRLPFSPHTQQDRFLRHSDTGPSIVGDWPSPDPVAHGMGTRPTKDGSASSARPRAWSVRTFQDFLPPLPQLHKKWCSWNSTSPFTKLVDSAPSGLVADCRAEDSRKVFSDIHLEAKMNNSTVSDTASSNASYPLTQPAQRLRRLNSASNLRRSRFTGPCFGLLSGPADVSQTSGGSHGQASSSESSLGSSSHGQPQSESSQSGKRRDFPAESNHVSVPVFAISEEEDRQPLVQAEHLGQASASSMPNGLVRGAYEGQRSPMGGTCLSPQGPADSPKQQKARPDWRPWGGKLSGGARPHLTNSTIAIAESKPAFEHSTFIDAHTSLSQPAVLCSVAGKEM
ncbi:uncharacterized protein si:dkey-112e17.1 [Lampris incognitus]|uniref:uncharacterized protein si:dkey-112e17.1 n=1 Tax=Lampris incognitus TaxID=2546036 RepID=UPI0024B4B7F3|nr:uncharacterized protein si:dkey-112e17.1 [Lampris incognitus]